MLQSVFRNALSSIRVLSLLALLFVFVPSIAQNDESVRADLPSTGALRVENSRGGVSLEVWNEQYVSVSTTIEGAPPARVPVIIQRTEQQLTVSITHAPLGTLARINLVLKVPERSRVEASTVSGKVEVKGLPAALSVQTVSGDIRALIPASSDASISAVSQSRPVESSLPTENLAPERAPFTVRPYQARLGAGTKIVRLNTRLGHIALSSYEAPARSEAVAPSANQPNATAQTSPQSLAPAVSQTQQETRRPPELIGSSQQTHGAGTPANDTGAPQEVDEGDVVRVDTQLVTVNMSVIDRSTNRGLTGLTQNDFKLYEDGAEQQITRFESAAAPFNLVLLIDLSGSTREVVNLIKGAALRFVNAARPNDRIAIITFASAPVIVSRLTEDRAALRASINSIEQPKGSTKLYDALAATIDEVARDAGNSRRNAIVLMSDGLDSVLPNVEGDGSAIDYQELLSRVREFDGVLYTLWLNTEYEPLSELDVQEETFDLAHDRLKELAEAGGGLFYEVERLEDLAGAYERVVADLGTVYSLSYTPKNHARDGRWRSIRVVVSRPNAVARGKRGYYAN